MVIDRLGRTFGFAVAALTVAGIAQTAFAGDPVAANPPSLLSPIATTNWTGLYAGGDVGTLFTGARFNQPGPPPGVADTALGLNDPRPTYGAYAGFNYQVTPWVVVGIEADYTKFSAANYLLLGSVPLTSDILESASHVQSLTGRIGFVLWPDTLVYGRAGPARMKVQYFDGFNVFPTPTTLPAVQTGVGIESLVTPNIAVRAEASYTYADRDLSVNSNTAIYRPSFLQFQLGLAYKFDAPAGWGDPGTRPTWMLPSLPLWNLWGSDPATAAAPPAMATKAPRAMATKAPPRAQAAADPNSPPNWTGFEAGGFISGNGNELNYINAAPGMGNFGPFTDFVIGGGWFVGANYQYQRIVVGAEFSGNYESANFNDPAGSGGVPDIHHIANIDRVLALTGRLGVLATPATLFYLKWGPAWMKMTPDFNYWNGFAPNTTAPTTFSGWQEGIGAETYIMRNLSVRAEAVYTRTGRQLSFAGPLGTDQFTIRPSILSALIGLALHI
jgi:outer membrane immunogenic protein